MKAEWEGQQQENEPETQHQALDDEEEDEDILDMGEDDQTNDKESLLMRFCPHDSSMLYPQVSLTTKGNQWSNSTMSTIASCIFIFMAVDLYYIRRPSFRQHSKTMLFGFFSNHTNKQRSIDWFIHSTIAGRQKEPKFAIRMPALPAHGNRIRPTPHLPIRFEKRGGKHFAHRPKCRQRRSDAGTIAKRKLRKLRTQRSRLFHEWFHSKRQSCIDFCVLQLRSQVGELNELKFKIESNVFKKTEEGEKRNQGKTDRLVLENFLKSVFIESSGWL